MRKLALLFVLFAAAQCAFAQGEPSIIDSAKRQLALAKTDVEKFSTMSYLARVFMTIDPRQADRYGEGLFELSKTSRNKQLIVEAYLVNGDRFSYLSGRRDNIEKAVKFYNEGLDLAKKYRFDTSIVTAYLALSKVHRFLPDFDKALAFCTEANTYSSMLKNDSVTAMVSLEYGAVYLAKNLKLNALRNFLSTMQTGEKLKSIHLQRLACSALSGFYASIDDYDKSLDFQVRALNLLDQIGTRPSKYTKIQELNRAGDLYSYAKDYKMADVYYQKALQVADSLDYEPIKPMTYRSIIFNYLNADEPQKALDYFNAHPQLTEFLVKVNFGNFVDQSYGLIYLRLKKYDSAMYYYRKVSEFFEKDVNVGNKYGYYYQMGILHMGMNQHDKSMEYFTKAKAIADGIGDLNSLSEVVARLDTLSRLKGDYRQAYAYAALHNQYKDSIATLSKQKDLMQAEAADEQLRVERLKAEQEERRRQKLNIQYISIIFAIFILFIALIILGMFKVSAGFIKAIGFFVFLILFEFIFLVFKKSIYSVTHGELWLDLIFMIGLAALLVPLHHWLEHKVLHYLTSHNRLTAAGHHFRNKVFRKGKRASDTV